MFQARVEQARVQRRPYTLNFIEIAKQLRECGVEDPHEVEPLLRSEKYRDVAVFAVMGLSSTNYKPSAIAIGDLRDTIRRTGLANPGETEVAALQLVGCCGPPLDNVPFFKEQIAGAGAYGVSFIMKWLAANWNTAGLSNNLTANELARQSLEAFRALPKTDPRRFGWAQVPIEASERGPFGTLPLATTYCDALASVLIDPGKTPESLTEGGLLALLRLQPVIPQQVDSAVDRIIAEAPRSRLVLMEKLLSASTKSLLSYVDKDLSSRVSEKISKKLSRRESPP